MKTPASVRRAVLTTLFLAASGAGLTGGLQSAEAASPRVKLACARDFLSLCRGRAPESAAARQCMRANGSKLSRRCVKALQAEGEVTPDEAAQRAAAAK